MSLPTPRLLFGVHSWTPYSRTTGLPYGTIKVIKSSSLALTSTLVELMGGSSKYAWAVEDGPIQSELNVKASQYEDFMYTLFLGFAPTDGSAEPAGAISALSNTMGTSVFKATTGIASVAVTSADDANLKFGKYVIIATSTTAVDVYIKSDISIGHGTPGTIQNGLLKITSTPITIVTSGALAHIPSFGMDMVGGSGTIGMTIGDTAEFSVLPDNTVNVSVNIGSSTGTVFPEFGSICMAQKRGTQELTELDVYRCKGAGMPIGFDQNVWSEYDIKIKCMYDSVKDGVFGMRYVQPSN
jgi:hypothetical protein